VLGRAAGLRVWATARSRVQARAGARLGADEAFEPGERLPERVDAVMETVGAATWEHSLKRFEAGRTLVISGRRAAPTRRPVSRAIFFLSCRVVGSTMGTPRRARSASCGCASSATCAR
jgi:D-arabinose 1-dehydrogenase-like Zn-dependent alcohol dehydrogenase